MIQPEKIMVALDTSDEKKIHHLFQELQGHKVWIKIGMELFYGLGDKIIYQAKEKDYFVFLDLKICDIPNTVKKSMHSLARLPIDMINIHAFGGKQMMLAAREGVEQFSSRPKLIAVTQLTSLSQSEMNHEQNVSGKIEEQVIKLAALAKESGLDGVVSSAWEVGEIKNKCGTQFITVTPGIRPTGDALNDQKRVMTPTEAIKVGSDYLVIGRPITDATSPRLALDTILKG